MGVHVLQREVVRVDKILIEGGKNFHPLRLDLIKSVAQMGAR